jgi:hypothetical protein
MVIMTKKLTMYQCEICNSIYKGENEATSCEAMGTETPLANVGDLVDFEIEIGGGFDNVFVEYRVREISSYDGHFLTYNFEEESETGEWKEVPFSAYSNANFLERLKFKK